MYGLFAYMDGWLLWFSCRKARYDWRILEDQGPIEKEEHNPLWNSDSKSPEHQSLEDEISYLDLSYFIFRGESFGFMDPVALPCISQGQVGQVMFQWLSRLFSRTSKVKPCMVNHR